MEHTWGNDWVANLGKSRAYCSSDVRHELGRGSSLADCHDRDFTTNGGLIHIQTKARGPSTFRSASPYRTRRYRMETRSPKWGQPCPPPP